MNNDMQFLTINILRLRHEGNIMVHIHYYVLSYHTYVHCDNYVHMSSTILLHVLQNNVLHIIMYMIVVNCLTTHCVAIII